MNKFLKIRVILTGIFLLALLGIAFFALSTKPALLSVKSVVPQDKTLNQNLHTTISVTFSRPVTPSEKTTISIVASPKILGSFFWSSDNKTVSLVPSGTMSPEATYSLTVTYGNSSLSWSFKTAEGTPVSLEDQGKIQGQMDATAGEQLKAFYNQNPWYNEIPIISSNYFVGYDGQRKIFFAYLYPKSSSPTPMPAQVAGLKLSVVSALKNIGANPDSNKIEWVVSPK